MRITTKSNRRAGFTLIELAIVLAITALLTAGLWRMMSSGNTQLRDQATADQHRDLIKAVKSYLESSAGSTWLWAGAVTKALAIPAACPAAGTLCDFLPAGFNAASTNSYNQLYGIRVNQENATSKAYSFMIYTRNGDQIPDTSGGRISSMIGNDGGFVYVANVCGANFACGAYGSWSMSPAAVAPNGYGLAVATGRIASRTYIGMDSALNTYWLARKDVPGDGVVASGIDDYNTIQTDISLGGKTLIGGASALITDPSAGAIENIARLSIHRTMNVGFGEALEIDGCITNVVSDPLCDDMVTIRGGVSIRGVLKADKLYAGSFIYESSDSRLKHDIVPISDVLGKFAQMKGYSFVMNGGTEKKYGVIAQEVEKAFPEVVHNGGDGHLTVDYMGLIGPLVGAVNELKRQNDSLKADIEMLKKAQSHHK